MFDTHLMIRTDDRTLQEAPDAFDAVSVNITYNPFILRVINPFMLCVGIVNSPIRWHFVRVNRFGVRRSVVMDKLVQGRLVSVRDNLQPNLSGALNCSNSDSLVPFVAASQSTHLSADIGFINFHDAAQKLAVDLAHGRSDTVAEIPSRLVSNAKRSLHLKRTHS